MKDGPKIIIRKYSTGNVIWFYLEQLALILKRIDVDIIQHERWSKRNN